MDKTDTLTLIVTEKWFDLIWVGMKTEDFRELKDYWTSRLQRREYEFIKVVNGYGNDRPYIVFNWNGYRVTEPDEQTDLGVGQFYAVKLGKYIEHNNFVTEFVTKIATEPLICHATDWISAIGTHPESYGTEYALDEYDFRLLEQVRKSDGKIKPGDEYIYYRGIDCSGEHVIFTALPYAHEFNRRNDMYVNAC